MLGKSIGIVRNVDQLGRITIPKEITKTLNWSGKLFRFKTDKNLIIVSPTAENEDGRKIDSLNRLVVPKSIRNQFAITEGTPLEMMFFENRVTLKVYLGGETK